MTDASPELPRSTELLSREGSRLLIVDVQQKLLPLISVAERVVHNCHRLIRGAQVLGIPVAATEQYPKGLGATAPQLAELLGDVPEKLRFSCAEVLNWPTVAEQTATDQSEARDQVVVAGIEAHVCVQQTVLDLMARGFRVYVVTDAVASRGKFDWEIALRRMADTGATLTTVESVLFEWCETAAADEFKQISSLIKEG